MANESEIAVLKAMLAEAQQKIAKLEQDKLGLSVGSAGNQVAAHGGIVTGSASNSLLMTGGEIHGDVYLGKPTEDPREALAIYCRVFFARHRHLLLRAIVPPSPEGKASEQRPELAQVYVALDTKALDQPAEAVDGTHERHPATAAKRLSALAATILHRRMVLLGDPGSGKSTFVTHLGLCLAAHALFPDDGWLARLRGWPPAEATLLPICVVLRDFARSPAVREHQGEADANQLWQFIETQLVRQKLSFARRPIEMALERGEALLILDGLDEIPSVEDRQRVRDAVQAFADHCAACRLIATCRTLSYQSGPNGAALENVPAFELAPFDEGKIDQFISAWYDELGRIGEVRPEEVPAKRKALQAAVRRPDIRRLAPNPLLLAVMAAFHVHRGRLPDQRAQLYEETINLLLWNWEQTRAPGTGEEPVLRQLLREAGKTDADLYRTLARRAFLVHLQGGGQGDGPADITEPDLVNDLRPLHPKQSWDWAHDVLDAIRLRAGLLIERTTGIFAFPHRTFQEYLAGAHLAGLDNFATTALDLAKRDLPLCREVLLLAAGKQAHFNREIERPLNLVDVLCPARAGDTALDWRLATLAGEVLVEVGVDTARTAAGGDEKCDRVRERLVALLEGEKLLARERAAAGDVLAAIGDPRFRDAAEWCLPVDEMLGFVEIPAGPFLMGSDKARDVYAQESEQPQRRVELPAFLIARFPATVAQLRAFVQATGTKLEEVGLNEPATRPMIAVSLDEACSYCAWLDGELRSWPRLPAKLRQALERGRVTLPSEAEWEKAARGTDGRIYSWGDEWNPERANTFEAGIGSTSAVGCFRSGRSPNGCEDMKGNVFELTRSRFEMRLVSAETGRESPGGVHCRVRGAPYSLDQVFARAAFRLIPVRPAERMNTVGFRVVVSPSVSDP